MGAASACGGFGPGRVFGLEGQPAEAGDGGHPSTPADGAKAAFHNKLLVREVLSGQFLDLKMITLNFVCSKNHPEWPFTEAGGLCGLLRAEKTDQPPLAVSWSVSLSPRPLCSPGHCLAHLPLEP